MEVTVHRLDKPVEVVPVETFMDLRKLVGENCPGALGYLEFREILRDGQRMMAGFNDEHNLWGEDLEPTSKVLMYFSQYAIDLSNWQGEVYTQDDATYVMQPIHGTWIEMPLSSYDQLDQIPYSLE